MKNDVKTRIEACILDSNYPDEFVEMAIKQLDELNAKAKALQKLKEEMKQDYIATKQVNDEMALRDLALLDDYLKRIDELDGTNEFSNLLDEMNKEDK